MTFKGLLSRYKLARWIFNNLLSMSMRRRVLFSVVNKDLQKTELTEDETSVMDELLQKIA